MVNFTRNIIGSSGFYETSNNIRGWNYLLNADWCQYTPMDWSVIGPSLSDMGYARNNWMDPGELFSHNTASVVLPYYMTFKSWPPNSTQQEKEMFRQWKHGVPFDTYRMDRIGAPLLDELGNNTYATEGSQTQLLFRNSSNPLHTVIATSNIPGGFDTNAPKLWLAFFGGWAFQGSTQNVSAINYVLKNPYYAYFTNGSLASAGGAILRGQVGYTSAQAAAQGKTEYEANVGIPNSWQIYSGETGFKSYSSDLLYADARPNRGMQAIKKFEINFTSGSSTTIGNPTKDGQTYLTDVRFGKFDRIISTIAAPSHVFTCNNKYLFKHDLAYNTSSRQNGFYYFPHTVTPNDYIAWNAIPINETRVTTFTSNEFDSTETEIYKFQWDKTGEVLWGYGRVGELMQVDPYTTKMRYTPAIFTFMTTSTDAADLWNLNSLEMVFYRRLGFTEYESPIINYPRPDSYSFVSSKKESLFTDPEGLYGGCGSFEVCPYYAWDPTYYWTFPDKVVSQWALVGSPNGIGTVIEPFYHPIPFISAKVFRDGDFPQMNRAVVDNIAYTDSQTAWRHKYFAYMFGEAYISRYRLRGLMRQNNSSDGYVDGQIGPWTDTNVPSQSLSFKADNIYNQNPSFRFLRCMSEQDPLHQELLTGYNTDSAFSEDGFVPSLIFATAKKAYVPNDYRFYNYVEINFQKRNVGTVEDVGSAGSFNPRGHGSINSFPVTGKDGTWDDDQRYFNALPNNDTPPAYYAAGRKLDHQCQAIVYGDRGTKAYMVVTPDADSGILQMELSRPYDLSSRTGNNEIFRTFLDLGFNNTFQSNIPIDVPSNERRDESFNAYDDSVPPRRIYNMTWGAHNDIGGTGGGELGTCLFFQRSGGARATSSPIDVDGSLLSNTREYIQGIKFDTAWDLSTAYRREVTQSFPLSGVIGITANLFYLPDVPADAGTAPTGQRIDNITKESPPTCSPTSIMYWTNFQFVENGRKMLVCGHYVPGRSYLGGSGTVEHWFEINLDYPYDIFSKKDANGNVEVETLWRYKYGEDGGKDLIQRVFGHDSIHQGNRYDGNYLDSHVSNGDDKQIVNFQRNTSFGTNQFFIIDGGAMMVKVNTGGMISFHHKHGPHWVNDPADTTINAGLNTNFLTENKDYWVFSAQVRDKAKIKNSGLAPRRSFGPWDWHYRNRWTYGSPRAKVYKEAVPATFDFGAYVHRYNSYARAVSMDCCLFSEDGRFMALVGEHLPYPMIQYKRYLNSQGTPFPDPDTPEGPDPYLYTWRQHKYEVAIFDFYSLENTASG